MAKHTNVPVEAQSVRPSLLTIDEARAELRISRWMLYKRFIHTRQLPTVKIGSRTLIPRDAVQSLIERLRSEDNA